MTLCFSYLVSYSTTRVLYGHLSTCSGNNYFFYSYCKAPINNFNLRNCFRLGNFDNICQFHFVRVSLLLNLCSQSVLWDFRQQLWTFSFYPYSQLGKPVILLIFAVYQIYRLIFGVLNLTCFFYMRGHFAFLPYRYKPPSGRKGRSVSRWSHFPFKISGA